ncbi:TPA: NAD(P)/FAD-dependent oxidoreductase, partial [Enterococcus faecium]|nr:NAD(P)/FAD-dependent oxidoreductase [Enterococcus faecium]
MEKIVIIGSNHSGLAAAQFLNLSDSNYEVILIDKKSEISYLECGTALFIKREVSNLKDLFYQNRRELNSKIKKLFLETVADKIDIQNKKIICVKKDGTRFSQEYDKVILATGSK